MSPLNIRSWKNGQVGVFALIMIIILILLLAGGRHYFRNTGHDLRATAQDAGQDLKSTGRDVADSIRHDVQ